MKIIEKSFGFKHLLCYEKLAERENWAEPFKNLEKIVIFNGVYRTGPMFFSVDPVKGESKYGKFTYYVPVNTSIKLKEEGNGFEVKNNFEVRNALCVRFSDSNFGESYKRLREYAEEKELKLSDRFYCMCLEVYGELLIDVYAPIVSRGD